MVAQAGHAAEHGLGIEPSGDARGDDRVRRGARRLIQEALLAIYHAHQEHTWSEDLIEEVEVALDRTGLRKRLIRTPAICFLDISGYTRLTEERGDEAAAELAIRLTPLVQRQADRHGGKVVKWLGDGVMLHFRRAEDAVPAAIDLLEAVADAACRPRTSGSRPDRWSSRAVTTSVARSTLPPGSRNMRSPGRSS